MKYVIFTLILFVSILEAREYKAVFDCSASNAHYIKNRMLLIDKTISMIEAQGDSVNFAITLHGSCVPMVSKVYQEIVSNEELIDIAQAQEYITHLAKEKGVKVIVCAMSLEANAIKEDEVLTFVTISKNSFIDTIFYQNIGYALISLK